MIVFGDNPHLDNAPPSCLGMLENLVVLNLSYNNIGKLAGSGIRNLQKLEELDLSYNQITNVDALVEELAGCRALKVLKIGNNPIEQILGM